MSDSSDDELGLFSFSNKKEILKGDTPVVKVPIEKEPEESITDYYKRKGKRKRLAPVQNPTVSAETVAKILEEDDEESFLEEDITALPSEADGEGLVPHYDDKLKELW